MAHRTLVKLGIVLSFLMIMSSCVTDADYSLENTVVTAATLETNLLTTTLNASSLKNRLIKQEHFVLLDTIRLESFSAEPLNKANVSFTLINSLETEFKVHFEFLDDNDDLKYVLEVPVSSGSIDTPISVESIVRIEEFEIAMFKDSKKLICKIILQPNTALTTIGEGNIKLQSKAVLFFDM